MGICLYHNPEPLGNVQIKLMSSRSGFKKTVSASVVFLTSSSFQLPGQCISTFRHSKAFHHCINGYALGVFSILLSSVWCTCKHCIHLFFLRSLYLLKRPGNAIAQSKSSFAIHAFFPGQEESVLVQNLIFLENVAIYRHSSIYGNICVLLMLGLQVWYNNIQHSNPLSS